MSHRILKIGDLEEAHRRLDHKLKTHMISGRGRHLFDNALVERLLDRSAIHLYGVNVRARIRFAHASKAVFRRAFKGRDIQFTFVTFTPRQFAVPLSEAAPFDHEPLKSWVSEKLRRYHFSAVVEVALYTNANALPDASGPMVSWHAHAIVWGEMLHLLEANVQMMNLQHAPLLPGGSAVHMRMVKGRGAISRLIYMAKAPLKEYRVYPLKEDVADPETGELTKIPLEKFGQKKRPFRPGDAVKAFKVLGQRTIPMLAFAGGEGEAMLRRALHITRSEIRRQDHRRQQELACLLDPRSASQFRPSKRCLSRP